MYAYTDLKTASFVSINKNLSLFSSDSGWKSFVGTALDNIEKAENVITYCIMCHIAVLGWGINDVGIKLPAEIVRYAMSDSGVSRTLREQVKGDIKSGLPEHFPNESKYQRDTLVKLADNAMTAYGEFRVRVKSSY
ncbi:MAG: hypothetical protein RPU39_06290 [Candidatus Sedimenticola sp. (ex Thyasira tokunagai)]